MGDRLERLVKSDSVVADYVRKELDRQESGLEMIPSENYVSMAVLEAMGTVLTNKYSEGYPGRRYYAGNEYIDQVESLAIERAKKAFGVPYANVQPYSGTPANHAVYMATCSFGDVVMGQSLPDGGHLTHGWNTSFSGLDYKSVQYHVKADGYIDLEEARSLAKEHRPKLIWVGASAYSREFPFEEFSGIAEEVGAVLAADVAHVAGLIVGGVHKDPAPYVHVITTTTHKTLRGPRGAMVMVTKKGLNRDPELGTKIDKAVFPGLQGGPHDQTTAAIAVALGEALRPDFKEYARQVVQNAKTMAQRLMEDRIRIVSNGTDNHLMLLDLTPFGTGKGVFVQDELEGAAITVNKNTIPADPSPPFYPSGIRLGTPALTTRGMKEPEMELIADWIAELVKDTKGVLLPEDKQARKDAVKTFKGGVEKNPAVVKVKGQVVDLCKHFPLYPEPR